MNFKAYYALVLRKSQWTVAISDDVPAKIVPRLVKIPHWGKLHTGGIFHTCVNFNTCLDFDRRSGEIHWKFGMIVLDTALPPGAA